MKKLFEQYFGCEVKISEYMNKLTLPIFMTMRDIKMVEVYLINPVQKVITIMRNEATFEIFSAGETALSQVSELNPSRIEECAIYKGEEVIDRLEIVDARCEKPDDCLNVQLWKYNPSYFARDGRVDPVSLACTFKGNEDERIEMSIDELLEDWRKYK